MHFSLKPLAISAVLMLVPNSAAASDDDGFCSTVEAFAKGIMLQRQNGGSFSEMMSKARTGDTWEGLLVEITKQAFDEPRWYDEELIDRTSTDFANEWAANCYRVKTTPKPKAPLRRKKKS